MKKDGFGKSMTCRGARRESRDDQNKHRKELLGHFAICELYALFFKLSETASRFAGSAWVCS
jgi:hypothetical protein